MRLITLLAIAICVLYASAQEYEVADSDAADLLYPTYRRCGYRSLSWIYSCLTTDGRRVRIAPLYVNHAICNDRYCPWWYAVYVYI